MNKPAKKKTKLRKFARAHAVFFLISFGLYVALSAILTPSFILSDMRNKSTALADETISIVGKVLAPPVKPIVSGPSTCRNGILGVKLNWADDENSTSFDINRNDATLITNLIDSQYVDTNVSLNTTYTYTVIAHGPMGAGIAISDPLTVTTITTCIVGPIAKITSFQNKPITNSSDIPKITEVKPTFSGISAIPFAKIFIVLHSGPEITAVIYANANGYWSWTSPVELDSGNHSLVVTTIDPNDPTIVTTDELNFKLIDETVLKPDSNNLTDKKTTTEKKSSVPKNTASTPSQKPTEPTNTAVAPFAIAIKIENSERTVYAGDSLSIHGDFINKSASLISKDYEIFYALTDSDGQVLSEISEKINPAQMNSFEKNIPIPILTKAGKYKIIVKTYDGRNLIESEDSFQVQELPMIGVGAVTISLTQIMQSLGWISLLLFVFFIILLGMEYSQSEGALIQITENYLCRKNFFTKRKGVHSR